ncbi:MULTISPECIES: acyl-CoA dehydrogenase family protein [unclassified Microbacterium]|uniref:acyl-CoA dehydrogenase family protein n=1 Tax=unclassified Microbacterium TaxID=2609290 RepID=UPI00214CC990|nr:MULTISPECIES: acyl-CoA dehydrogenase family protein [unclassified Microbacterium]MCR2810365.1 acyl-CoA dehydrogenase family protein [Microbacterium sp. zg.B185]WIM18422.1 acyl-CoA dehydrogenase family protein [Microbacterium sp. zg-B185]
MSTIESIQDSAAGSASASLTDRANGIGPILAANAARHDREGTFVVEAYDALREAGLLKAAVPRELGGDGASIRELADLQRTLGHYCGATALASAMHQHVTRFTTWRYRRGLPGAEATLRRIADEQIVLVSTGGGDFTHPTGQATPVAGGYRVSGRKRFVSQGAVGTVMSTMVPVADPERGMRVLNMAIPFAADGIVRAENWDVLGMRGTASDDVVLTDVFVPHERVLADRPYGVIDPPLQVIAGIGFAIISGAYLGVAEAAFAEAVAAGARHPDDLTVQRSLGLMRHRLQVASWALAGALTELGDDPTPSYDAFLAVMAAKAEIARAGAEVCDLAMQVVGGAGYFTGSIVERCYRDIRAAAFHPLTPEATLLAAGRHAMGLPQE